MSLSSRAFWRPGGWENLCRLMCHCVRHIGLDSKHGRSVEAIHLFLSRWKACTALCRRHTEEPCGKRRARCCCCNPKSTILKLGPRPLYRSRLAPPLHRLLLQLGRRGAVRGSPCRRSRWSGCRRDGSTPACSFIFCDPHKRRTSRGPVTDSLTFLW